MIRQLSWYLRNPLQNLGRYVIGVYDRNYIVIGTAPFYAANWSDVHPDKTGWKVSTMQPRPLVGWKLIALATLRGSAGSKLRSPPR